MFGRRQGLPRYPVVRKVVGVLLSALMASLACSSREDMSSWDVVPVFKQVVVEQNPLDELTLLVRFTTDIETTAIVEFGTRGVLTHAIRDDDLGREHELVVLGVPGGTQVELEVVATSAAGVSTRSQRHFQANGHWPFDEFETELTVADPDSVASRGWVLTTVYCT